MPAVKKSKSPAKSKRPAPKVSKKPIRKAPAKKSSPKKAVKKAASKTKKAPAKRTTKSQGTSGINVRDVLSAVDPNIKLTDDAVELLEALITDKFTEIAQKAVRIVHRGKQEDLGCDQIKQAVEQVFKQRFDEK